MSQHFLNLPSDTYQPLSATVIPEWALLIPSGLAFSVLFDNKWRDYLWVVLEPVLHSITAKFGGDFFGPEMGVFCGGVVLAAYSNSFARLLKRPALTVLLPGLIPMVPGSIGYQSVLALFNHDMNLTMDSAFNSVIVAVSLSQGYQWVMSLSILVALFSKSRFKIR